MLIMLMMTVIAMKRRESNKTKRNKGFTIKLLTGY